MPNDTDRDAERARIESLRRATPAHRLQAMTLGHVYLQRWAEGLELTDPLENAYREAGTA